jgi:hypothetical protein
MSEEKTGLGSTWFGKILRGIIKLALAGFIVSAVNAINIPDLNLSGSVVSGSLFKAIIQFAVPMYLIFSALHDFGVKI